jgi:hypothetical protein
MRARALALVLLATSARAEEARRFEAAADLGYAFPVASAASGARMSDATVGLVAFEGDLAYRVTRRVGVVAWARYGMGVPTLCKSASDCTSSLGTDVALAARARFYLPSLGHFQPRADVGVGYEWLTTRLTDSGVTSTHAYHGPVLFMLEAMGPLQLSDLMTLGPTLGVSLGVFGREALDTPSQSQDSTIRGRAIHLWVSPGARIAFAF